MLKDIDVLRVLLAWPQLTSFSADIGPGYYDGEDVRRALTSVISALEARERAAVLGRMSDSEWLASHDRENASRS